MSWPNASGGCAPGCRSCSCPDTATGCWAPQRLLDEGTELIQKPFTATTLLTKVSSVLTETDIAGGTRAVSVPSGGPARGATR